LYNFDYQVLDLTRFLVFKRDIESVLQTYAQGYPAIAILGPRQSGKTTIAQTVFNQHHYVSLENLNNRIFAQTDPEKFLRTYDNPHGVIIDEVQHVPELLSYIQTVIDAHDRPGYFILTGSQNFMVHQSVSQTLAGRVAIVTLLPLSIHELVEAKRLATTPEDAIIKGGYPRIYNKNLQATEWYTYYINTYVEQDVRQVTNVIDLITFERFLKLCAGHSGQMLNMSALASQAGITQHTAKSWLSILQASYIIFLLQPHYNNFNKRLVKMPKLYFYDTGLACTLLGITDPKQLRTNFMFGALFENYIIADLMKNRYNAGKKPNIYFWRDNHGHEVDCVIERGNELIPLEIKGGETITRDFFDGLDWWNTQAGTNPERGYLVYGGTMSQQRSKGQVIAWNNLFSIQNV
jgi:predicted AAA+ superfamily ATPase